MHWRNSCTAHKGAQMCGDVRRTCAVGGWRRCLASWRFVGPCRCGVASRRTITPAAEIMTDRCTPEYERTLAKMAPCCRTAAPARCSKSSSRSGTPRKSRRFSGQRGLEGQSRGFRSETRGAEALNRHVQPAVRPGMGTPKVCRPLPREARRPGPTRRRRSIAATGDAASAAGLNVR